MQIEERQVRALVGQMRVWGHDVDERLEQDLVDEFQERVEDKDLKGGGQFRRKDPDTSRFAAAPRKDSQRYAVLLAIIRHNDSMNPGLCLDEIYDLVDPDHERGRDSWGPRIGELKRGSWIYSLGRTRKGASGTQQQILVATTKALAWARQKGLR